MDESSPSYFAALVVVVVVVGGIVGVSSVAFAGGYSLSMADSVETPEQTVSPGERTYEISSVGIVDQGDPIHVTGTGTDRTVELLNADGDLVATHDLESQMTFETSSLEPGSYVVAIDAPGVDYEDVYPVVVSAYDLETSHPSTADADEEIDIDVTVSQDASQAELGTVQVAVWNDDTVVHTDATHDSGDVYSATISTSELDVDTEYSVYAVAQGTEEVDLIGEHELLGVSDDGTVTITESTDDQPPENGDGPPPGDGDDGSDDQTDEPDAGDDEPDSDDQPDESDDADAESDDEEQGDDSTHTDDDSDGTSDDETTETDGSSSDEDDDQESETVVQPNPDDEGDDDSSSDSIPLSGPSLILVGLTAVALFTRFRT
ncbi:hypothetical protein [Natrialba sp. INN-245]|uniref:hypothetical protein n=1 Tax=Natrialba sp. INN-245 TaxID=2690967 RepID=UPI001310723B|nr:hypothetical protein [Natrialba sp. INN-245]MWV40013.1 hypothetical protein [Natrialba sp. INN-245]